jgi:hypothetical protein
MAVDREERGSEGRPRTVTLHTLRDAVYHVDPKMNSRPYEGGWLTIEIALQSGEFAHD